MAHKTFIPKRFFSKCRISKRPSKWINSELVEVDESLEFEGNNYIVTTAKNYIKHDELRIYYIERVAE